MDKYIKQLLLLHSKIILPQFGAIVIEDEETGELMFNEYLSYDDGKLSELIEKESNMGLQEAQNMVAKFVRELQAQLDKGETYSIFQLGEFSKNEDGEFLFSGNLKTGASEKTSTPAPTPTESEKSAPVVTPIISEEKKAKEVVTPKKEEKPAPKSDDTSKKNTYVEKKDTFPKSESDTVKNTEVEKKKEKPVKVKKEKIKKEKVIVPPKVRTPKKTKDPKKPGEENEKKKRSPFLYIIIIILILFAAASILIGLNYDKVEEYMGWNKFDGVEQTDATDPEKEVIPEENELVDDEEFIEEPIEEKVKEEPKKEITKPVVSQSSKGNHHIIVGCFSELSNAQGLADNFKQHGFDSKIIGQYGGLHFVSAQSYPSSGKAYNDLSRVRQIQDSAWLFNN